MENLTVLPYLRIYFRVLNAIEKSCLRYFSSNFAQILMDFCRNFAAYLFKQILKPNITLFKQILKPNILENVENFKFLNFG